MKKMNWKELMIDVLVDIVAGMIIAIGIYNFALNANFPVAGFFWYCDYLISPVGYPGWSRYNFVKYPGFNFML